jgi:hypothetical protein
MMTVQRDFLGIQDLEELSASRSAQLQRILEDMLSPDLKTRCEGMNRLYKMDAHRRSPLAACFLVYRLTEQDLSLRRKIVQAIDMAIRGKGLQERSPAKVRKYLHHMLRGIGPREIHALVELLCQDEHLLEPVCGLLNQCSASGEILVKILNSTDYPLSIRIASCKVIGQIGFLEARQAVESLEKRLVQRTTGQLAMAFAPSTLKEARELIPILRDTLDALWEASI